jgi:hypothetical protein
MGVLKKFGEIISMKDFFGKPILKRQIIIYKDGIQDKEHERIMWVSEKLYQQITNYGKKSKTIISKKVSKRF